MKSNLKTIGWIAAFAFGGLAIAQTPRPVPTSATLSQFGVVHRGGETVRFNADTLKLRPGSYIVVIQDTQDVDAQLSTHLDAPDDGTYYSVTAIVQAHVADQEVTAGATHFHELTFTVPRNLKNGAYYSLLAVQAQDTALKYRIPSLGFWFKL